MTDRLVDQDFTGTDLSRIDECNRQMNVPSELNRAMRPNIHCQKVGEISHKDIADLSHRFDTKYQGHAPRSCSGDRPTFRGYLSAQSLSGGLSMGISDIVALTDTHQSAIVPRSLSIALQIGGDDISARLQGREAMNLKRSSALAVGLSGSSQMSTEVAAGTAAKTVVVQCNPDMLQDDELISTADHLTRSTWVNALPVPPRWNLMAAEMLAPKLDGLSHRLMAESFALDMVSTMVDYFSVRGHRSLELGVRDKIRLQHVRDLIEADPQLDHSLAGLARQAGISVATLKRKFPILFGTSVIAYLRDLRLDRAHNGICKQGWTVAEAAHFSGYAHVSNFTTAFRRRHGVTPGAISATEPYA